MCPVFRFFFFKQRTACDMRISDWSSDVCSSDLRQIGIEKAVAHGSLIRKTRIKTTVAQFIKKQPADAARFIAMLEKKICVAPAFVRQITRLAAEWLAQIACHPMPMAHILVERVKRGEVEAATKPPHRIALCRLRLEITHVHVRGRPVGIARMAYQRARKSVV